MLQNDFINQTAKQLKEAGQYMTQDDARAAIAKGMQAYVEQRSSLAKKMVDGLNRWQRRRMGKKVDKAIQKMKEESLKPSEQFARLSQEQQKKVLLRILLKVKQQNQKYEELKKDGEGIEETSGDMDC